MLDKNKPYGTVSGKIEGAVGARFTQDGILYNGAGEKVGGTFVQTPVKVAEEAPAPVVKTIGIVTPKEKAAPVVDENGDADNVSLDGLHWATLKKMVVDAGGEYTTKPAAIAFLSAK